MDFFSFFAIKPQEISQNCIVCQNYDLSLFMSAGGKIHNGLFVKTIQTKNATIIGLKNNFAAGDAVFLLRDTACRNIFLFGACGVFGGIKIGSAIAVERAYNLESFSTMAQSLDNKTADFEYFSSSKTITDNFCLKNPELDIIKTNSACVGSLFLESKLEKFFAKNNIGAVDMESSIIFCASNLAQIPAACFMYASDKVGGQPNVLTDTQKARISSTRKSLASSLKSFLK
ncbi:MAG: hypothetical protein LBB93_05940 [Elusimicrobiota bacterium]|jgi:purine-nucleoside phosphorylase|nr:hypothetical protein [Elusimicrobiota bacterium]